MKALLYTNANEVTFREEPDPRPDPGEGLIRVDAVGICGSDRHAYHGKDPRRNPPLVLGAFGDLARVEERPLAEGARAFRDLHDGAAAAAKILLRPR
jgi:hypothetical protein